MTRTFACGTHDRRMGWRLLQAGVAGCIWTGCTLHAEESDLEARTERVAVAGPWQIPPEVRAAGDAAEVPYVGGGAWLGEESCSGQLTQHALALRELLLWAFPQITFISDYACRPIGTSEARTSVHGVGRALDLHIPLLAGGEADNELGDPVGNWLVENAQALGVQYVIWDGWQWISSREPGARDGSYGGSNPHRDHLHVEVTSEPPELLVGAPCDALPREGGLIDEAGTCVARYGPEEFWRLDDSTGYGGSLYWTNAFTSDVPSNWARYTLRFDEAGEYLVRAHVPEGYDCFEAVRYEVQHAEGQATVTVDQSASQGWLPVGTYLFATDEGQWVDVFDDTLTEVDSGRHIVVDALRVDRVDRLATEASTDGEVAPEQRLSSAFAPGVLPAQAPAAEGEPRGASSADPETASPEAAESPEATEPAGSTRERSGCAVSAKQPRAPPGALFLSILLAWLLRRARGEWTRGRPNSDRWYGRGPPRSVGSPGSS